MTMDEVFTEGIRTLDPADIEYAAEIGYAVKLLALASRTPEGIDIRVHPTLIPLTHPLAQVSNVDNAIYVIGDAVGETMFFGPGAGAGAAASAVVGDVIEVARAIEQGYASTQCTCVEELAVRPVEQLRTRYYIRMLVDDKPGVLAAMASVFATHQVSIESVIQRTNDKDGHAEIVYVTHKACESDIQVALSEIGALEVVQTVAAVIRVEEF
jgi:homoserine dehydrogenase